VFLRVIIFSQIDIDSEYDQTILHKDSGDYIACQTTHGMNQLTRMIKGATDSVSAFVELTQKMGPQILAKQKQRI